MEQLRTLNIQLRREKVMIQLENYTLLKKQSRKLRIDPKLGAADIDVTITLSHKQRVKSKLNATYKTQGLFIIVQRQVFIIWYICNNKNKEYVRHRRRRSWFIMFIVLMLLVLIKYLNGTPWVNNGSA
jgi:hypothetical protein